VPLIEDVRRFYTLLREANLRALEQAIEAEFRQDIVLRVPASLPYGGVVHGAAAVKEFFRAGIAADRPMIDVRQLEVVRMTGAASDVAAVLRLPFRAPRAEEVMWMRVMEWWHFHDGRVAELDVFYEDSSVCVNRLRGRAA
jgi:ketosteroid isomerase-like protein